MTTGRATAHRRTPGRVARTILLWWLSSPAVALGVEVTDCGQVVAGGDVAELRAQLACGAVGPGIVLGNRATLNLNGFDIAGPGTGENGGVSCGGRRCTVNGPGEIRGFAVGINGTNVRVTEVAVRSNSEAGVSILGGVLRLSNVFATGNGIGVFVPGGRRLHGSDVEVSGNKIAGIWASGAKVTLSRLIATGNGTHGGVFLAKSRRPRPLIVGSAIIDNAGLNEGYDVLTMRPKVRLVDSTCYRGAIVQESPTPPTNITVVGPLGCRDD